MANPFELNDGRQEQLALRPTSISNAAAEAYAPNSAHNLEQRSLSSASQYITPLQLFDSRSDAASNPVSSANDASYFTNERSTPTAVQSPSDSSSSPVQSLMNDLQTGLSNPVQGLLNLTDDLNPLNLI